jgi:hypothetical protein
MASNIRRSTSGLSDAEAMQRLGETAMPRLVSKAHNQYGATRQYYGAENYPNDGIKADSNRPVDPLMPVTGKARRRQHLAAHMRKVLTLGLVSARERKPTRVREYKQGTRLTSPAVNTGKYATSFAPVMEHSTTVADLASLDHAITSARGETANLLMADGTVKGTERATYPAVAEAQVLDAEAVDYSIHGRGTDTRKGYAPLGRTERKRKARASDAFFKGVSNSASAFFVDVAEE